MLLFYTALVAQPEWFRRLAWSVLGLFCLLVALLAILSRPPEFNGTDKPVRVRVYTVNGARCDEIPEVLRRLHEFRYVLAGRCQELDPVAIVQRRPGLLDQYFGRGEVALIIDRLYPEAGNSGEITRSRERFFLTHINPAKWNRFTVFHEIAGHIAWGHTAIRVPLPSQLVNFVLDTMIQPYEILGGHWVAWSAIILAAICWLVT